MMSELTVPLRISVGEASVIESYIIYIHFLAVWKHFFREVEMLKWQILESKG